MEGISLGRFANYTALPLLFLCSSGKMPGGDDCTVLHGPRRCVQQGLLLSVRTSAAEFGSATLGYQRLELVLSTRACPASTGQIGHKRARNGVDVQLSFDYRTQGRQLFYYTGLVNTHSPSSTRCERSDVLLFALQDAVGTRRTTAKNRGESPLETVLLSKKVVGPDTLLTYAIDQHTSDAPHLTHITFDTKFHVKQVQYDSRGLIQPSCQADSLITFN
jgi:hypothetical protein